MIKTIFNSLASSLRQLFHYWGALLIMLVLYGVMLGAVYLFFVTREATIGQLILSLVLALLGPLSFLIIQTMAPRYRDFKGSVWRLLGSSLRDFWKLLVIALPLIAIAALAIYLLAKIEPGTPPPTATIREAVRTAPAAASKTAAAKSQPVSWQAVVATTLQYLIFCLVLPLTAIHLWIATARVGLKPTFGQVGRIARRAFAPQAVITYAIGFVFFAVIPYFLVVTRTPASS